VNELINIKCKVCHQERAVNTANRKLFESQIVQENYVCMLCDGKVKKMMISLICAKCKHPFKTKILAVNKDKYGSMWECPACMSNAIAQPKVTEKKNCIELNCADCKVERGVCVHPELNCTLSKNFPRFGNGDLFYLKDGATILSVHAIDESRPDIHCFEYTILYRNKYALSPRNHVIIRQRLGSKKSFMTNVIVYKYNAHEHKFNVVFDEKFDKGKDWIVPMRDFLLK